jgi:hypothetical protein
MNLYAVKNANGKQNSFSQTILSGTKRAPLNDQMEEITQPLEIRLTKRGRSYIASARIDDDQSSQWVELQKLTALRADGRLAIALGQHADYEKHRLVRYHDGGESTLHVDSVKIERLD